jgi:hypothetical protein
MALPRRYQTDRPQPNLHSCDPYRTRTRRSSARPIPPTFTALLKLALSGALSFVTDFDESELPEAVADAMHYLLQNVAAGNAVNVISVGSPELEDAVSGIVESTTPLPDEVSGWILHQADHLVYEVMPGNGTFTEDQLRRRLPLRYTIRDFEVALADHLASGLIRRVNPDGRRTPKSSLTAFRRYPAGEQTGRPLPGGRADRHVRDASQDRGLTPGASTGSGSVIAKQSVYKGSPTASDRVGGPLGDSDHHDRVLQHPACRAEAAPRGVRDGRRSRHPEARTPGRHRHPARCTRTRVPRRRFRGTLLRDVRRSHFYANEAVSSGVNPCRPTSITALRGLD